MLQNHQQDAIGTTSDIFFIFKLINWTWSILPRSGATTRVVCFGLVGNSLICVLSLTTHLQHLTTPCFQVTTSRLSTFRYTFLHFFPHISSIFFHTSLLHRSFSYSDAIHPYYDDSQLFKLAIYSNLSSLIKFLNRIIHFSQQLTHEYQSILPIFFLGNPHMKISFMGVLYINTLGLSQALWPCLLLRFWNWFP